MEEPDLYKSETKDGPYYSTLGRSTSRRSTPGRFSSGKSPSDRSTPGRSNSGRSTPGLSTSGRSTSAGRSTPGRSTPDRSTTPEPPPVPPATYHWDEVRKKRSVGGYPWTHLNKPPFDEKTFVKHQRDHVYEPVTPTASKDRLSSPTKQTVSSKTESRHFLRIPLTEEIVMADETGSEPEEEDDEEEEEDDEQQQSEEEDNVEDEDNPEKSQSEKPQSDESIYEGENENSSVGEAVDANNTRLKVFQQKVKVKADILRTKLQGVTKRKPKQKIVVDTPNGEKNVRRKFGQFATLPKKFTFNAPKVNFSNAFSNFSRNSTDVNESSTDDTKSGRFSLPRFRRFSRTSSESPKPSKSTKIGSSRLSIPGFRVRTWSDASKISKPDSSDPTTKAKLMDFSTYPRIFSKRRKTNAAAADKAKTPPPTSLPSAFNGVNDSSGEPSKRKDSFRRRFFRSHKESTPAPSDEQTATLAVEEELDESHVSKESLAEFGDSDLQEVISLSDDCSRSKDTKSLSEHRPGVIEEIDSDEFFLREKGLSRGDVHISNYLSSEIRDVFRSNRTRSVEGVNNNNNNKNSDNDGNRGGTATPVRPSRTNSLRRTGTRAQNTIDTNMMNRFSTMPKSFGGTKPLKKPAAEDYMPENIITSQTFEPTSSQNSVIPSTFRVPWRTAQKDDDAQQQITHMPPKPPSRQRMSKFSTFDTRSMIDLSRKRSQSQIGFLPSMNFSETVPKAPLRRSRTSLAGSERDVSVTSDSRPSWSVCGGVPTPPLRRSRMSLTTDTDVDERSAASSRASAENGDGHVTATKQSVMPPRPPPPSLTTAAGYATVDKSPSASLLIPPQSPVRQRRKKSYEVIKSQEFGAFFTIPRSYSYSTSRKIDEESTITKTTTANTTKLPPPSRPARAYNTLGPSRPHRRRLPLREHEYGDVPDDGSNDATAAASSTLTNDDNDGGINPKRQSMMMTPRSLSLDEAGDGSAKGLFSGDVIEKMKLRPLPSPPPPPRKARGAPNGTPESHRRRNTDSALVPFLDQRETSVTSSDDFFADVSRALLASAAKNSVAADDISIGVQTDPLPDGYELDDLGSCCSAESDRPMSRTSLTADRPTSRTSFAATATCSLGAAACTDRPTSRTSMTTEYVDRPTSRVSSTAVENGYVMIPGAAAAVPGVMCAQRISVNELQVGKMIVADIRGQRMGVDDISGSSLKIAQLAAANSMIMPHSLETNTAAVMPPCDDDDQHHHHQDDAMSVQSSRVSSMYPEVDSDEDRTSVLAVPTPPRRRSKPANNSTTRSSCSINKDSGGPMVDLSAAASDPSITELSCQLFRLCHSNVCSLFNKVVQQVVPEDTEKRRDLQAALCFLSIILAGLLILGFGNEKTIHHHHWDFQFPPPNQ